MYVPSGVKQFLVWIVQLVVAMWLQGRVMTTAKTDYTCTTGGAECDKLMTWLVAECDKLMTWLVAKCGNACESHWGNGKLHLSQNMLMSISTSQWGTRHGVYTSTSQWGTLHDMYTSTSQWGTLHDVYTSTSQWGTLHDVYTSTSQWGALHDVHIHQPVGDTS